MIGTSSKHLYTQREAYTNKAKVKGDNQHRMNTGGKHTDPCNHLWLLKACFTFVPIVLKLSVCVFISDCAVVANNSEG
jgi:hypothetical protein